MYNFSMKEEPNEISSEEYFRKLIKDYDIDIEVDTVTAAANKAFDEVAGLTQGASDVWNTITLPQAVKVYRGSNPLKLGQTLLQIIDKAGTQEGAEATIKYLKSAVPKDEVDFSESDKKVHSEKLVADIESFITEYAVRYGTGYKGTVAVVIWGSYARFQQRLDSDIDFSLISVDHPLGFSQGDLWVNNDDFEELLRRKLDNARGFSVDMQNWGTGIIADEQSIRGLIELETPEFLVASPFPEVKEKVQRLLQDEVQKNASDN